MIEAGPSKPPPHIQAVLAGLREGKSSGELLKVLHQNDAAPIRQDAATADLLRSWAVGYGKCPFKAGDLVTVRKGGTMHGEGWPHIVLEVAKEPMLSTGGDESGWGSNTWGARLDMRVLHANDGGHVHAHWVESWQFEPWVAQPFEVPFRPGAVAAAIKEAAERVDHSTDQLRARLIEALRGERMPAHVAASGWSAQDLSRRLHAPIGEIRDALSWAVRVGAAEMTRSARKRAPRYRALVSDQKEV